MHQNQASSFQVIGNSLDQKYETSSQSQSQGQISPKSIHFYRAP